MARTTKKRSSPRRSPWAWVRGLPWPRIRRATTTLIWMLFLAALVTAWIMGVPSLQRYASARNIPEAVEVRFRGAPAWVNGELSAELVSTAAGQMSGDPFDRGDLIAVRRALLETGWFDQIRQVRRVRSDLVEVDALFLEPCAVVRDQAGDHLVDQQGRLLPRTAPIGHASRFRFIDGAQEPRPPSPGVAWPGQDVRAALQLNRLIDSRPWRSQVVGIDIARFRQNRGLSLITDRGQRILWGRPPGEEAQGEVTVERKLYYLDYPYEHFGHIDSGYDGDLDITDPRGVFGR